MLDVEQSVAVRVVRPADGVGDLRAVVGVNLGEVVREPDGLVRAPTVNPPLFRRPIDSVGLMAVIKDADLRAADRLP